MRKLHALSIVEVLVYFALFGIIFLAIINFMISVLNNNEIAEQRVDLQKNSIFVMNHLNSNFDLTNSIDETNSIFDNNNGKIVLNLASGQVQYYLVNGVMHYIQGGNDNVLTDIDFTVTKFNITKVLNSKNELVGTRFDITFKSGKSSDSFNLQTSMLFK